MLGTELWEVLGRWGETQLLRFLPLTPPAPPVQARASSYNGEYGGGGGERFSHSGYQLEGPITAIRVRVNRYYIVG